MQNVSVQNVLAQKMGFERSSAETGVARFGTSLGDLYYKMVSPLLSPMCPSQEHIFQLTHLKDPFKVTENQS